MELKNSPELKKALTFCGSNIRSESEVKYKISKFDISDEDKESILSFLKKYKFFFDDEVYLEKYFENIELNLGNQNFYKLYTRDKIKNKLLLKRIPSKLIDKFLNSFTKINDDLMLEKFINKNQRKIQQKEVRSRISYISSKGFNISKVIKALKARDLL